MSGWWWGDSLGQPSPCFSQPPRRRTSAAMEWNTAGEEEDEELEEVEGMGGGALSGWEEAMVMREAASSLSSD